MNYLLDTCVISELVKKNPNPKIIDWVRSCKEDTLFLSVLTLGEIQKGITKLPDSQRKEQLEFWIEHELPQRFKGRILDITSIVAKKWGDIQGNAEQQGVKMPVIDGLIAATGLVHDLTVVTRNDSDMKIGGVKLFNPWQEAKTCGESNTEGAAT
jgi:predicted nucleic acid-binding protein